MPNGKSVPVGDIAILELKQPVKLSKNINIACLFGAKDPNNGSVITAGWGSIVECTGSSDCKYPEILQATKLQVVSREQCNKQLGEAHPELKDTITNDYICAKDDVSGLCDGDYGGFWKLYILTLCLLYILFVYIQH